MSLVLRCWINLTCSTNMAGTRSDSLAQSFSTKIQAQSSSAIHGTIAEPWRPSNSVAEDCPGQRCYFKVDKTFLPKHCIVSSHLECLRTPAVLFTLSCLILPRQRTIRLEPARRHAVTVPQNDLPGRCEVQTTERWRPGCADGLLLL